MKKKIFLVDDDPTVVDFLVPFFSKKNYDAENFENGEEAFEKIDQSPPDLIISDIIMPRMDGFELYRQLRGNPKTARIPFIFLSSKDDPSDQLKGFRMGANEYLTKPFDLQHLFETIKKVLSDADSTRPSNEKFDFSGNLSEVTLEDIVQLIEMNQKTGELEFSVSSTERSGSIFFKDGRVVHAVTNDLAGEEAFYYLGALKKGFAKFFSKECESPETISNQTMALLFEAARMKDESKTLSSVLCDPNTSLRIKSREIPPNIKEILGEEWVSEIIRMIENEKTAAEIITSGKMSRIRAENILAELIKAGVIHATDMKQPPAVSSGLVEAALADQIREIESSSLTGILEISGGDGKSCIHFYRGRIDQALHGAVSGKKALFRIFAEKGRRLNFKPKSIIIEGVIESDLTSLLNEAGKEIKFKQGLTDDKLNSRIIIMPGAAEKIPQNKKGPDLAAILTLAAEKKAIGKILEASPLTDLKTIDLIVYLKKLGLIKIEKNG